MHRLGYDRYVAQGGDVGRGVTDTMGRQAPDGLLGIHMNLLVTGCSPGSAVRCRRTPTDGRARRRGTATLQHDGSGYFLEQATRPQTIGYALLDSPVALAAWMLDHDTDSLLQDRARLRRRAARGRLTRTTMLDNISLYWLTEHRRRPAARLYWENGRPHRCGRADATAMALPAAFTAFPGEIFVAPKSWVEQVVSEPRLLPQGRAGRPLRRLGGAGALRGGGPRRVPIAALTRGATP